MNSMQRVIYAGFAACALASVSKPALSWTTYPDVDFEWYANVGKTTGPESNPAPRAGYIWAPGHYEWDGTRQLWAPGTWVRDEQAPQWRAFRSAPNTTSYTTGPLELRDRDGNVIPTDPAAYPIDPSRR